eukprot:14773076-Ditylum_brightwellii.AAC.1
MAAFESKLNTHFIACFEQQDVGTRLCSLQSLNNASNKMTFKEEMLRNIQQRLHHHVNDLVTDEMEVDKFEGDELGNYSMEVLILAVQATYCSKLLHYTGTDLQIPSQFIIWEKGNEFNHFFALHSVPGDK